SVSVHQVDRPQGDAEIGYWVAPWARGQGYAVRSVVLASRFALTETGAAPARPLPRGGQPGVVRGGAVRRLPARGQDAGVLPLRRRGAARRARARPAGERPGGGAMSLRPVRDGAPADWLVARGQPWPRLSLFG